MNIKRNIIVEGHQGKKLLADLYAPNQSTPKPVVLFVHGFKGFKDWGIWDLLARSFAEAGYVFIKFNFSHNGTTLSDPLEFQDLPAFGENNFTKELADIDAVIQDLEAGKLLPLSEINLNCLAIIGHSRGGGTAAVKAATDERIKAWIGWASVSDLAYLWRGKAELIEDWKKTGVHEIRNGRTGQMMPLYYQLYQDFERHQEAYDLARIMKEMAKPTLVIHGTADPAVPVAVAEVFKNWNPQTVVALVEGADHVFGGSHPFTGHKLPEHAQILFDRTLDFLGQLTPKKEKPGC